jgi:hypothetical protein
MRRNEIDNLISRVDISLRNDWGVTRDERSRMRAIIHECRDAIKFLMQQQDEPDTVPEVSVRADEG